MKKKMILIIGAFVLILGIGANGTYAVFQANGEKTTTQVTTTSLDISIHGDTSQVVFDNLVAGETIKKELAVINTEATSLYTRVTIQRYWLNQNGEKDFQASAQNIILNYNKERWLEVSQDEEEIILYYKVPLTQNQRTENFLESITIPNTFGNQDQGKKFVLDIQVDAVQSLNVKDAMLAQWGVLPTVDTQGALTKVER